MHDSEHSASFSRSVFIGHELEPVAGDGGET